MAVIAVLVPFLTVIGPALLVGLILWLVSRRRTDDGGTIARAARRHELLVSALAVAAAAVTAVVLAGQPVSWPDWAPAPGITQAAAPFAVASVFALVRAAGELTWPRPQGEVRAAPLTRRTPWSVGGARLKVVVVTGGVLAIGLVLAGVTADPTGRAFAAAPVLLPGGDVVNGSSGPYPGWPYGVPMLLGLAATGICAWLALTAITRRRPLSGLPTAHDEALRRTSTDRLLAVVQLCLGFALGATAWMAGHAIERQGLPFQVDQLTVVEHPALVTLGTALMIASPVVIAASGVVAALALRSRRVRHPRSSPTPGFVA